MEASNFKLCVTKVLVLGTHAFINFLEIPLAKPGMLLYCFSTRTRVRIPHHSERTRIYRNVWLFLNIVTSFRLRKRYGDFSCAYLWLRIGYSNMQIYAMLVVVVVVVGGGGGVGAGVCDI